MERDKPPKGPSTSAPGDKGRGKGRKLTRLYERPRGGAARSVGDLMPQIGRTAFRRFGFVQSSVVTRWPEIVGPHYSRSEEHTSELQSLMRISYAVFCLKKKTQ